MNLYHFKFMNPDYAKKNEDKDFMLLEDLFCNSKLGADLTEYGRTNEMDSTDATAQTKDNKILNMELKRRFADINTYQSLMIEGHKYISLMKSMYTNKIPVYINFMNNGYVCIYNLLSLKEEPYEKKERVWSELYQAYEFETKLYLPIKGAWIYQKQGNKYKLIQKGW